MNVKEGKNSMEYASSICSHGILEGKQSLHTTLGCVWLIIRLIERYGDMSSC